MICRVPRVTHFAAVADQLCAQAAPAFPPLDQIERPGRATRKRYAVRLPVMRAHPIRAIIALCLERAFCVRRYLSFNQQCFHVFLRKCRLTLRSSGGCAMKRRTPAELHVRPHDPVQQLPPRDTIASRFDI